MFSRRYHCSFRPPTPQVPWSLQPASCLRLLCLRILCQVRPRLPEQILRPCKMSPLRERRWQISRLPLQTVSLPQVIPLRRLLQRRQKVSRNQPRRWYLPLFRTLPCRPPLRPTLACLRCLLLRPSRLLTPTSTLSPPVHRCPRPLSRCGSKTMHGPSLTQADCIPPPCLPELLLRLGPLLLPSRPAKAALPRHVWTTLQSLADGSCAMF